MRKLLFLGLLFLFASPVMHAVDEVPPAQTLWQEGNRLYQVGDYRQALSQYVRITNNQLESFELYYNMGSAYYQLGQMGYARLWFERARLLKPTDPDVQHNLKLLRVQIQEEDVGGIWTRLRPYTGILFWSFPVLNILFFALLIWGLSSDLEWIWWGRWILGISLVLATGLLFIGYRPLQQNEGVVVAERAEVKTGPGDEFRVGFVVPEGHRVVIFRRSFNWFQIGLPSKGLKGWVATQVVEAFSIEKS